MRLAAVAAHLELDCPAFILVKHVEDVVCKLTRVAEREELPVDLLELCISALLRLSFACELRSPPGATSTPTLFVELAVRAVFQEPLVLLVSPRFNGLH